MIEEYNKNFKGNELKEEGRWSDFRETSKLDEVHGCLRSCFIYKSFEDNEITNY